MRCAPWRSSARYRMDHLPDLPCEICGGRRYHRTLAGWARCASCWPRLLSHTYIKPPIRESEIEPPTMPASWEPWPLRDRIESGSYPSFRHAVWGSLLYYADQRVAYEYLDAWRLAEIHFERDHEFKSVRDLGALPLLILVVGVADPPNSYIPELVRSVCNLRRMHGKPTWVYSRAAPAGALQPAVSVPIVSQAGPDTPRLLNPWD